MRCWRITALFPGLALVVLALAGCGGGPKLVKAVGVVKYKNAPVPNADLIFMADDGTMPSVGRTDDEGRFTVCTGGRDGAPVGSYKVGIIAAKNKRPVSEAEAAAITSEQIAANRIDLIPIKYNNHISSGLTATVSENPDENNFTFDLK